MGFIEAALNKTHHDSDELLNKIGKKLPKKVRKKLHWKKIAPILSLFIALLNNLVGTSSGQRKVQSVSTAKKRPSFTPPVRHLTSSKRFSDDTLQSYVEQAEAYQAEIDHLVQDSTDAANQHRVREVAAHVQAWTTSIINLAQRIENFRQNKLINTDLKEVPKSIASLEARLSRESDPMIIAELERTVNNRRQQLAALEKLQRNIQMAEIKIESTLSMLGAIYSQILAGQSTRQVADYRRLLDEIDEEVHTLQDHLEALEEIKLARV